MFERWFKTKETDLLFVGDLCLVFSVTLPFSESGVQIEKSPSYINIKAKLGLLVKWNEDDAFLVRNCTSSTT